MTQAAADQAPTRERAYAAEALITGEIKGTTASKLTAGMLGGYTVSADGVSCRVVPSRSTARTSTIRLLSRHPLAVPGIWPLVGHRDPPQSIEEHTR